MYSYGCLALLLLAAATLAQASEDNESCYSFAGGSVYPAGENKGDHQLQYTKAVSKWLKLWHNNIYKTVRTD